MFVYLLAVIPIRQHFAPASTADFSQYYMGGLMARQGLWESIYPVPVENAAANPGNPGCSMLKPAYAEQAELAGVHGDMWRFIQPPPAAVFMIPLSWLSYDHAYVLFRTLLCVSCAVVAVYCGRFAASLRGTVSKWDGALAMVAAVSPTTLSSIRSGNVSPIVAACVAVGLYELAFRQRTCGAFGIVTGALLKYVTALLIPVALVFGRWRAVWQSVALGLAVLTATYALSGPKPFEEYFFHLSPHFDKPEVSETNQALRPVLIQLAGGMPPPTWLMSGFQILRFASIGTLLVLMVMAARRNRSARVVVTAGVAVISWFLVFSPLTHGHYYLYLFSLWGWVLIEAGPRLPGKLMTLAVIAAMWIPLAGGRWSPLPVLISCHMLYGGLTMLVFATDRLLRLARCGTKAAADVECVDGTSTA